MPTETTYVMAAPFDGVPGSFSHPYETHIGLSAERGALLMAEAGYVPTLDGKADSDEYSTELYYRDTVYQGLRLQPDRRYIMLPGIDTVTKDAPVLSIN